MPDTAALVAHVHVLALAVLLSLPLVHVLGKAVVAGQHRLDGLAVFVLGECFLKGLEVGAWIVRKDGRSFTLARIHDNLVETSTFDELLELAVIDVMEGRAVTADEHIGDEQANQQIYVKDVEVEMIKQCLNN